MTRAAAPLLILASLLLAACPGRDRPADATNETDAADDLAPRPDAFDAQPSEDVPPPRLPDVTLPPDASSATPFFHRVFRIATHNSYWIERDTAFEPFASGVRMRLLDQLLFHGVRALEIDVHRDRNAPMRFRVFHTNNENNVLCSPLEECLATVATFHRLVPNHEALTLVIELKELVEPNFDDTHTPADLDSAFAAAFGEALYRPSEFLARCAAGSTLTDCARTAAWPTTREMRGRILFSVIGNYRVNFTTTACHLLHPRDPCLPSATDDVQGHGPLGWLTYATWGGGVRERAGFPMRSNWVHFNRAIDDERAPPELVTAAEQASAIWQVEDLSDPSVPDFIEANGLVRGADSFSLDAQRARVAAGFQFLQTDHPWLQIEDQGPSRPFRPLRNWDVDPTALEEPGKRLFFHGPVDPSQSGFAYATIASPTCTLWQSAIAITRPPTDPAFPNMQRGHGTGCLRASAASDDASADHIEVCRSSDPAEYAVITFATRIGGTDATTTLVSPARTSDGAGEMLRMDVCTDAGGTRVDAFTSGAFGADGNPQWIPAGTARTPALLSYQGIAASQDVLFVNARRDGTALSRFDLAAPVVPHGTGITPSTDASLEDLSFPAPTSECHDPGYPIGCNAP